MRSEVLNIINIRPVYEDLEYGDLDCGQSPHVSETIYNDWFSGHWENCRSTVFESNTANVTVQKLLFSFFICFFFHMKNALIH